MKKSTANIINLAIIASLFYSWFVGDFAYQNIITAVLIILNIVATVTCIFLPLSWSIVKEGDRKEFSDKILKGFTSLKMVWVIFKSLMMITGIALNGYVWILVWFVLTDITLWATISHIKKYKEK